MRILFKILFIITMCIILSSCTSNTLYYGDANQYSKIRHFKKPIYTDSTRGQFYATGSYNTTGKGYYYKNETASFGEGSIHFAHSSKGVSGAYGISAFSGKYKVVKSEDYAGNKDFWGYAISSEFSFGTSNSKWKGSNLYYNKRPFGLRVGIFHELGDFEKFRQTDENTENLSNNGPYLFFNIFAEFEEMVAHNKTLGYSFALGYSDDGLWLSGNAFITSGSILLGIQFTPVPKSTIFSFQVGYKLFDTQRQKKKEKE